LQNKIIWKDFGYENNYEAPDIEKFKHIQPLEFEKEQYFEAFKIIVNELANN
jgi:hypothetical protein